MTMHPGFEAWADERQAAGAFEERLGSPISEEELAWAKANALRVIEKGLESSVIEVTSREADTPGVEVLAGVVKALVDVSHHS